LGKQNLTPPDSSPEMDQQKTTVSPKESLSSGYQVAWSTQMIRTILRPIFRGLFYLLSQVKIVGKVNIPTSGAYLIVINHVSLYEPPFILAFWPVSPEAAGAVDLWDRAGQSTLARLYGGIQVHRGEYDRELIDTILHVLRSGYPLLIAPEGGRSHSIGMRRAMPGAAFLVDQADVPIVPVGICGTSDDFLKKALELKRPKIEMRIGQPFRLPPIQGKGESRRTARQRNADLIMLKICELLPEEYHGFYHKDNFQIISDEIDAAGI